MGSNRRRRSEEEDAAEEKSEEESPSPKRSRRDPIKEDEDGDDEPPEEGTGLIRCINPPGKPPEAGVIKRIYVENFMCHKKLTVDLCRNVNFIHGQNGSGKSAILAAVQICLGAGARRTHRARNLKELVRNDRDGSDISGAKVRVTLLNGGDDGYKPEVYGETITVERCIPLRGGYSGYKLYNHQGEEVSRSKADLDDMLDQLNIQVENPVAVLDQEDAKKFITGKAEDKYRFFMTATELERIDRTYAATVDHVYELDKTRDRLLEGIEPAKQHVAELERKYKQYEALGKLEAKVLDITQELSWAEYWDAHGVFMEAQEGLNAFEEKIAARQQELTQAEGDADSPNAEEDALNEKLANLAQEAEEQAATKKDLEAKLKRTEAPTKAKQHQLKQLGREIESARRDLAAAKKRLQEARDQILEQAGNSESEEAQRVAALNQAEEELDTARQQSAELQQSQSEARSAYEELEPQVEQAKQNVHNTRQSVQTVKYRVQQLESGSKDSLAIFGRNCTKVRSMVDDAQKRGQFKGPVLGPIGAFIKVAPGKEHLAQIAELALGNGTLDRFVVTNDHDRRVFQTIRQRAGCSRDCNVFQMKESPRYNVPAPPVQGIETVASALVFSHDLIFNCLVDNAKIETKALAMSRDSSEESLLLHDGNGKYSIRGKIKSVYFLPYGDQWMVRGGAPAIVGNDQKNLRKSIGVDQTAALAAAKQELQTLEAELREARTTENRLEHEHTAALKRWNHGKRASRQNAESIRELSGTIEELKRESEVSTNIAFDTSDMENDVTEAEQAVEMLADKRQEILHSIKEDEPEIQSIRRELEVVSERNNKVLSDIEIAEQELVNHKQIKSQREENLEKKRRKLMKLEEVLTKHKESINGYARDREACLFRARKLAYNMQRNKEQSGGDGRGSNESQDSQSGPTDEDLLAIEPVPVDKDQKYYEAKLKRLKQKIEKERDARNLLDSDQSVAFEKYNRARIVLDGKMKQIEEIDLNAAKLKQDIIERKRLWRNFRKHIAKMTNSKFDEILNLKGSSGELEFDHKNQELNLIVQKDNADSSSQQRDVKALSGGERSFTTTSLLIALGDMLETPFRVLDEFDVFLDAVTRKLAMETLVDVAKQVENRQFIFITPQDVSNLKPDNKLKILKLRQPIRNTVAGGPTQQTLDFSS